MGFLKEMFCNHKMIKQGEPFEGRAFISYSICNNNIAYDLLQEFVCSKCGKVEVRVVNNYKR